MGRLERHLDLEVIRRMKLGLRHKEVPAKRLRPIREADSYRAARRNAPHGEVHAKWKGATTRYEPYSNPSYRIEASRCGERTPVPARTYKPNGKRECARRQRQREARG